MKDPNLILLRPWVTEKSNILQTINEKNPKYVFEVSDDSNKIEIRNAVEKIFNVKVKSVNTINVKGKLKKVRFKEGKKKDRKKAIITLKEGFKIELF